MFGGPPQSSTVLYISTPLLIDRRATPIFGSLPLSYFNPHSREGKDLGRLAGRHETTEPRDGAFSSKFQISAAT